MMRWIKRRKELKRKQQRVELWRSTVGYGHGGSLMTVQDLDGPPIFEHQITSELENSTPNHINPPEWLKDAIREKNALRKL